MNKEIRVRVEGVSKKFSRDLKKSLWYGLLDIFKELLGIRNKPQLRKSEFWSVKDVSFDLVNGDCLGLIGHNGAGKSTLLKMLNGLIKPDEGEITMNGKVGALIELGTGFDPILSGRENVFNYGVILGFSHKEILAKYSDIVEFAELEGHMETPVRNYSSGMKGRLGFAVATQLEPDILIIDEVMAVGDIGFKRKCFVKVGEMLENTTVILVSHMIPQVARLCNRVIVLDEGRIDIITNNVNEGIERYYKKFETGMPESRQGEIIQLKRVIHFGRNILNKRTEIEFGTDIELTFEFEIRRPINDYKIVLTFIDGNQNPVASCETDTFRFGGKIDNKVITMEKVQFGTTLLSMNIDFFEANGENKRIQKVDSVCSFRNVTPTTIAKAPVLLSIK